MGFGRPHVVVPWRDHPPLLGSNQGQSLLGHWDGGWHSWIFMACEHAYLPKSAPQSIGGYDLPRTLPLLAWHLTKPNFAKWWLHFAMLLVIGDDSTKNAFCPLSLMMRGGMIRWYPLLCRRELDRDRLISCPIVRPLKCVKVQMIYTPKFIIRSLAMLQ